MALIPDPAKNLPLTPATPETVNPVPTFRLPLTPRPPVIIVAPEVDEVDWLLALTVKMPRDSTVDLNVAAPVTPKPEPTSKVEPIIVAPEMFAVPVTANVEAAVSAPLNVLAPANV